MAPMLVPFRITPREPRRLAQVDGHVDLVMEHGQYDRDKRSTIS
jgi:hypothetical protein